MIVFWGDWIGDEDILLIALPLFVYRYTMRPIVRLGALLVFFDVAQCRHLLTQYGG